MKYILALLNSKLYFTWLLNQGKKKGDMLELYYKPLTEIPIKKVSVIEQKNFVKKVDSILKITSKNYKPETDFGKISGIVEEINALVYKLFNLTDEEIKIVEASYR